MTVPGIVVRDEAILSSIRAAGDPELELYDLGDYELDDIRAVLTAAAPHLIRDWVDAVLARYPHTQPGLAELANGLPTEETP